MADLSVVDLSRHYALRFALADAPFGRSFPTLECELYAELDLRPDETMAKVKIEGMSPNELCCERGTLCRAVPERTFGRPRHFPTPRSPCL